MLRHLSKGVIDLLMPLPVGCLLCGGDLSREDPRAPGLCGPSASGEAGFCPRCWAEIRRPFAFICLKCGVPLPPPPLGWRGQLCRDCAEIHHDYDAARALCVLEGGLRDLVYDFKFSGQRYLAPYIGCGMAEVAARMLPEDAAVAAVPLHEDKLRQRGFNQAEALAEAVAGRLGVPFLRGLLVRVRRTSSLSGMGAAERRKELEGAFELGGSSPRKAGAVAAQRPPGGRHLHDRRHRRCLRQGAQARRRSQGKRHGGSQVYVSNVKIVLLL